MSNRKLYAQLESLKGIGSSVSLPVAEEIAPHASELAPKRTGYLATNIHAEETGNTAQVISEALYSGYVEFRTSRTAAQPFLRPAVDEYQRKIETAAANAAQIEIKRRIA